jgi:uncharacterized protein
MARPPLPRQIGCSPPSSYFKPNGIPVSQLTVVELLPEHVEVLRLCDAEGMYQAQAAESMGLSRPSVGRILTEARRRVALAISQGYALQLKK